MRTVIALLVLLLLVILGCIGFIYSGIYNVAATDHHWGLTHQILEIARTRSVRAHAAGIKAPTGFDNPDKLAMGVEHFAAHCAVCHGGPGVPKGDIGKGLYPPAPDLAHAGTRLSDAEMFWVIKNGIKMTGMPAWADHSDAEIWATVAFLKKLPGMTPEEYGKLIMSAMGHGGHQPPASAEQSGVPPAGQDAPAAKDGHRH